MNTKIQSILVFILLVSICSSKNLKTAKTLKVETVTTSYVPTRGEVISFGTSKIYFRSTMNNGHFKKSKDKIYLEALYYADHVYFKKAEGNSVNIWIEPKKGTDQRIINRFDGKKLIVKEIGKDTSAKFTIVKQGDYIQFYMKEQDCYIKCHNQDWCTCENVPQPKFENNEYCFIPRIDKNDNYPTIGQVVYLKGKKYEIESSIYKRKCLRKGNDLITLASRADADFAYFKNGQANSEIFWLEPIKGKDQFITNTLDDTKLTVKGKEKGIPAEFTTVKQGDFYQFYMIDKDCYIKCPEKKKCTCEKVAQPKFAKNEYCFYLVDPY